MKLLPKKTFIKDNKKYINIVTTEYNGNEYAFTTKINEQTEEVTKEYNVFTEKNEEIIQVNDYDLLNKLLPIFQEKIDNELKSIMKGDNVRGDKNDIQ